MTQHAQVRCVGCHAGTTRTFVDPETGERRDVFLDMSRFHAADHGDVDCLDCHESGFTTFPHFEKKTLGCMDCHPREEASARERTAYDFRRWAEEFEESVHHTEYPKEFDCHECHDPHFFEAAARLGGPRAIITTHNEICTVCHSADATGPLADPAKPSLVAVHPWLPHPELHLESTRCIDCHTSNDHAVSHDLLVGEKAEEGCVACHTRDSVLLTTLYHRDGKESPPQVGFVNTEMLRDGYVMGATRNVFLDAIAYVLVGGSLLFVFVHGILRLIHFRRRRGG